MPRLRAQPFSQSPSARVPTLVCQGKEVEQLGRHRQEPESMSHHCLGHSSRGKIARINIITATKSKDPRLIRQGKIQEPYQENFNLLTPPLTSGGRSRRRRVGKRLIIVDDAIFIDLRTKKRRLSKTLTQSFRKALLLLKTQLMDRVPHPS
jgi:hypothetical protein